MLQLLEKVSPAARSVTSSFSLFFFFLLIVCGNLLRFCDAFSHVNHMLLTESFLYGSCALHFFLFRKSHQNFLKWHLLCIYLTFSCLYGALLHGFDVMAAMYTVRLMAIIYSGVIIAELAIEKFRASPEKFLRCLLGVYLVTATLSLAIYFAFPESERLWEFLAKYQIKFYGDPHIRRFVSVYLDPNFYGAIGCIPCLIAMALLLSRRRWRYFFVLCSLIEVLLLTRSRSGIALFFLTGCACLALGGIQFIKEIPKTRRGVTIVFTTWIAMAAFLYVSGTSQAVFERFTTLSDPSAEYRYAAMRTGIAAIFQAPFFGVGYHFIPKMQLWVDSSLFVFVLSFGALATALFLGLVLVALRKLYLKYHHTPHRFFVGSFCAYVLFSVFFFSFFNQLVTYPFWLLPALVIYHFFNRLRSYDVEALY